MRTHEHSGQEGSSLLHQWSQLKDYIMQQGTRLHKKNIEKLSVLLLQEVSSTTSFALHFLVIGHETCSTLLILKTFLFFQCCVQG